MTVSELSTILDNLLAEGHGDYEVNVPSQTGGEQQLDEVWEDPDYSIIHLE